MSPEVTHIVAELENSIHSQVSITQCNLKSDTLQFPVMFILQFVEKNLDCDRFLGCQKRLVF